MAPSLSGLKLKMESESAIEVETEKIIILASEEKEVLPTHRLSFDPTIKERVLRRLSISDSKFDIPIRSKVAEESEEQPRLSGLDDASANTQLTEDVEDRETSLLVKKFLLNRVKNGKKNDDNNGDDEEEERHVSRVFQLAQFYFEEKKYRKALMYFNMIKEEDDQALFQIGVIMFDGLGVESDPVAGVKIMRRLAGIENNSETEAEEKANRLWNAKPNEEKKEKEKEMGKEKEYPNKTKRRRRLGSRHLMPAARYNIGNAYFQGYGVTRQSDSEAERWWLLASANGDPKGSIKAQSMLGFFYARRESRDLQRSFFWHSEACGNGSLESQGAIGVMYFTGLGVSKNLQSAFLSLKEASDRGNVYAMGNLVALYYERQMFCNASDLGYKISQLEFPKRLAQSSECLPNYVRKGIALACFYYGRCLALGKGVKADERIAREMYSKSCRLCPDITSFLTGKIVSEEI